MSRCGCCTIPRPQPPRGVTITSARCCSLSAWFFQREQNTHQAAPLQSPGAAEELASLRERRPSILWRPDGRARKNCKSWEMRHAACLHLSNPKSARCWARSAAYGCSGWLAMQLSRPGPGSGSPCKAKNSWGVTSSAFRLSSTCVCESTPLFFGETGCTRPPTEMVIKRETFI